MTKNRCNPPCSDPNSKYKERIKENRGVFMKNSYQGMWDGANSIKF